MKWHNTLPAAAVAALALAAGACDDGLAELNDNPNAPADVPAHVLLPTAIQGTVELFNGGSFNLEFTGLFAQHWAKIQYLEEDHFDLSPGTIDSWWQVLYAGSGTTGVGALKEWAAIAEKGRTDLPIRPNHEATGRVMKAFTGHIMTDIWGDIPWSEALQGDAEEPNTTPAYDAQQDVYGALVAELDAALALFDADDVSWGPEDLIFGGDVDAWARFANSLKLRLAVRASNVDAARATAWIEEVLAEPAGLIDENESNATLVFLDAAPNQNPLYENRVQSARDDHAVSHTLVALLASLQDPRLAVYAEPAASPSTAEGGHVVFDGEVYRGALNGIPESELLPLGAYSRIGDHWRSTTNTAAASTPAYLMTAAEVHFLLAEVALRGLATTPMTAAQHYDRGVTLAMRMYDGADGVSITDADIASYLARPGVAFGTTGPEATSELEQIIEQKWIALYTNGPEAYAEYRRTGFPDEVTIRSSHQLPYVPGRIPYPDVEQSLNREMWQAALDAQQIDGTYTGRVWWDPQAPGS